MASLLEEIAGALARDVIRATEELGDDGLVAEIPKVLGTSLPTTQEAFMTAVRVRLAEGRARRVLAERLGRPLEAIPARMATPPRPIPGFAEPPAAMIFAPPAVQPEHAPRESEQEVPPALAPAPETSGPAATAMAPVTAQSSVEMEPLEAVAGAATPGPAPAKAPGVVPRRPKAPPPQGNPRPPCWAGRWCRPRRLRWPTPLP